MSLLETFCLDVPPRPWFEWTSYPAKLTTDVGGILTKQIYNFQLLPKLFSW